MLFPSFAHAHILVVPSRCSQNHVHVHTNVANLTIRALEEPGSSSDWISAESQPVDRALIAQISFFFTVTRRM